MSLLAGLGLFVAYELFEGSLVRGASEFVFWPPLEPLPFAPMRGFTFEQLARHAGRLLLLGPALLLLAWPLARLESWRVPTGEQLRGLVLLLSLGAVGLSTWVMFGVLEGRPIFDDELTYRMQAMLLGEGRLAEGSVPPWAGESFTIWSERGATGKYLFGEPLIQVVGSRLGFPALLHLGLAGLSLLVWYRVVARECGAAVGGWATLLLALSPMFLLTTSTGLSQPTSLACLVVAGLGYRWAVDERPVSGCIVLGTALGFGLSVRPQVLAPASLILVATVIYRLLRQRRFAALAALALTGASWVGLILSYNYALTGSALNLPWNLFHPAESYGFGHPLEGDPFVHTPWTALQNLGVMVVRWNGWWLGWPLSLGLFLLWPLLKRPLQGRLWLAMGVAIVVFQIPYYSTGVSETGPVYQYELLLPASMLGGQLLAAALARWRGATLAFLVVHMGLGTTTFLVEKVTRLDRMMDVVHGPVEAVMERIEPPALVIYETALQESLRLGWLNSGYPVRYRSDRDPIVTYPRGHPTSVKALRERYSARSCWYYRVNPERIHPQLIPCAAAEALLKRPTKLEGPAIAVPSTAMRMGLLDPFARHRR